LKDIAKSPNGYHTVKSVLLKLWEALPNIHEFWGFSGGIDAEGVFFDSVSGKITILNWDKSQLPVLHYPGCKDELNGWKMKERFYYVYACYA
jgi:hypothetical protein